MLNKWNINSEIRPQINPLLVIFTFWRSTIDSNWNSFQKLIFWLPFLHSVSICYWLLSVTVPFTLSRWNRYLRSLLRIKIPQDTLWSNDTVHPSLLSFNLSLSWICLIWRTENSDEGWWWGWRDTMQRTQGRQKTHSQGLWFPAWPWWQPPKMLKNETQHLSDMEENIWQ